MSDHKDHKPQTSSRDDKHNSPRKELIISKPGKDGERGCRGKRGKRGHKGPEGDPGLQGIPGLRGPTGTNGTNGVTGPTGPCCTGPTGATGGSTPTDFAYTTNVIHGQPGPADTVPSDSGNTFPNLADVDFLVPGPTNVLGIVPVPPSGLRVVRSGTYQYGFQVRGFSVGSIVPLDFELRVNGFFSGAQNKFKSDFPAVDNEVVVVNGAGLIHLVANDIVSLRNVGTAVSFGANDDGAPPPNQPSVDASLYLVLVQAD